MSLEMTGRARARHWERSNHLRSRIGKAGLIRFIQLSDSFLSTRICVFLPPVSV